MTNSKQQEKRIVATLGPLTASTIFGTVGCFLVADFLTVLSGYSWGHDYFIRRMLIFAGGGIIAGLLVGVLIDSLPAARQYVAPRLPYAWAVFAVLVVLYVNVRPAFLKARESPYTARRGPAAGQDSWLAYSLNGSSSGSVGAGAPQLWLNFHRKLRNLKCLRA